MYVHIKGSVYIDASFFCCCLKKDQLYFYACSLYLKKRCFGVKEKNLFNKRGQNNVCLVCCLFVQFVWSKVKYSPTSQKQQQQHIRLQVAENAELFHNMGVIIR